MRENLRLLSHVRSFETMSIFSKKPKGFFSESGKGGIGKAFQVGGNQSGVFYGNRQVLLFCRVPPDAHELPDLLKHFGCFRRCEVSLFDFVVSAFFIVFVVLRIMFCDFYFYRMMPIAGVALFAFQVVVQKELVGF